MACKFCHKNNQDVKTTTTFEVGKKYRSGFGDIYLCARVDDELYNLINLQNGNRWDKAVKYLDELCDNDSPWRTV